MIERRGMQFYREGDKIVVRSAPVGAQVAAHAELTEEEFSDVLVDLDPDVGLKLRYADAAVADLTEEVERLTAEKTALEKKLADAEGIAQALEREVAAKPIVVTAEPAPTTGAPAETPKAE